jgi:hypothetical protein
MKGGTSLRADGARRRFAESSMAPTSSCRPAVAAFAGFGAPEGGE